MLDVESTPFIDVTAAHVLVELADDLERDDVPFAVARSIGDVRDVLDASEPEAAHLAHLPERARRRRRPLERGSAGLVAARDGTRLTGRRVRGARRSGSRRSPTSCRA